MAIPVSINTLLEGNTVEWARIEFKKNWNPETTLKTISAFANDIDNWGGGYIVIGIEEDNGNIKRPIVGLNIHEIDGIQKEILKYCNFLRPIYIPITEPVIYENANLLLVWCPGGYDRPYQCPKQPNNRNSEKIYYIRKLSSTIEASILDVNELISLSHNVPFDDRVNLKSNITDLKYPLIRNYLENIGSNLINRIDNMSVVDLSKDLRIADGPSEFFKPLNVGLLFFNEKPENFFPYSRIEVVNIPDLTGQGMEERIFSGPLDEQLKNALSYLKNNIIAEKVYKISGQAEAVRVKNYSYDALEEFVSNAVYHKSYQIQEPITIRIEKDKIEITSLPGPDRSISDDDIKSFNMRSRRYRNRRIGDFLKELHLIEGRNTGIPTAIKSIKENNSPMPIFLTDVDRSFFSVILPINKAFFSSEDNYISKRRNKEEIKNEILDSLKKESLSASSLYLKMGYKGNISKTFRSCIIELIEEGRIEFKEKDKNSSSNALILKK